MKKSQLIIIISFVVIVVAIFVFSVLGLSSGTQNATSSPIGNVSFPNASSTATTPAGASTGTELTIALAGGGTIQTRNFLHDPETTPDPNNPGYYNLGNQTATSSPTYAIEYQSATQFFVVTLLREPIGAARDEAQKYLLNHLGVTQDQLCHLNYSLGVPWWVNEYYSGRQLGFSFCPGATVLPQ